VTGIEFTVSKMSHLRFPSWSEENMCNLLSSPTNQPINSTLNNVPFEKLTGPRPVKKFCSFCGTRKVITMLFLSLSQFGEEYNSWSASLYIFHLTYVASSVLVVSSFLRVSFSCTRVVSTDLESVTVGCCVVSRSLLGFHLVPHREHSPTFLFCFKWWCMVYGS
jgi:hypothetical protein